MRSILLILMFVLFMGLFHAQAEMRTWQVITGGSFEAKLTAVSATKVRMENASGKSIEFPIADLKPSDQKYIQDWQAAQTVDLTVGESQKVERTAFSQRVYADLVSSQGGRLKRFVPEDNASPKYFAFYRSASWCPPCRKFTPKLVQFYKKQKRSGAAFELVFISSDKSEEAMADYMKDYSMDWPAFEFGKNKNIVSSSGGGIPNLIVTDANGKKLLDSYDASGNYIGPYKVMAELEKLLGDDAP